ncbi:MAG: DUF3048 domain-containing protein [Anaerolineae bacterium]
MRRLWGVARVLMVVVVLLTGLLSPAAASPAPAGTTPADGAVAPFTGLPVRDSKILTRRPLAIKVANTVNVRPQGGLSKADVVIEHRVEYNLTRMTAIFHSQGAERVGSIRSARLPDMEWPVIFDAVLCFSGASTEVRKMLYESDFKERLLEQALNGPAYFRDPKRAVPHNLYASTTTLWNVAQKRGWNKAPEPKLGWTFDAAAPAGGSAASNLKIPYPTRSDRVEWRYDSKAGRWLRWQGGAIHKDAGTNTQLSAANVVVLTAVHVATPILEHGTVDVGINRSIEIQVWGEGALTVYRDGKAYPGKWVRPERQSPLTFLDANGQVIPLKPGNTWMQLVPPDMTVTAQ